MVRNVNSNFKSSNALPEMCTWNIHEQPWQKGGCESFLCVGDRRAWGWKRMVREQGLHLTTTPLLLYVRSFYGFVNGNLIARKAINPNSITVVECGMHNIPSWLFGRSVCLRSKSWCLWSAPSPPWGKHARARIWANHNLQPNGPAMHVLILHVFMMPDEKHELEEKNVGWNEKALEHTQCCQFQLSIQLHDQRHSPPIGPGCDFIDFFVFYLQNG